MSHSFEVVPSVIFASSEAFQSIEVLYLVPLYAFLSISKAALIASSVSLKGTFSSDN